MEGFDLSTISDVYVGSTQYSEIYYGSNKVWPTDQQYSGFCRLTLNDDSVVELQGSGELGWRQTDSYKSRIVSAEIGNLCTSIGDYAFSGCSLLENVTIASNCTSIKSRGFQSCTRLVNINLSDITSIGYQAFYSCSSLIEVDLSNVTQIDSWAFVGCSSLISINNLLNIISIGEWALSDLRNITGSIDIGEQCTLLNGGCFKGVSGLSTMTFRSTVPPTCNGSDPFSGTTFIIKVPQAALETYKTATGFSAYASRIVGY